MPKHPTWTKQGCYGKPLKNDGERRQFLKTLHDLGFNQETSCNLYSTEFDTETPHIYSSRFSTSYPYSRLAKYPYYPMLVKLFAMQQQQRKQQKKEDLKQRIEEQNREAAKSMLLANNDILTKLGIADVEELALHMYIQRMISKINQSKK